MGFTVPAVVDLINSGHETNKEALLNSQETSVPLSLTAVKMGSYGRLGPSEHFNTNTELHFLYKLSSIITMHTVLQQFHYIITTKEKRLMSNRLNYSLNTEREL